MNKFKEILTEKIYNKVWEQADDVIESNRSLEEIYGKDVPEDLKDISVAVMEIHFFEKEHRDRVIAYLNYKPYNNSVNFIAKDNT